MDGNHLNHEQARLSDIVKRGIATTDANFVFILIFFVVSFLQWFAFEHIETRFLGSDTPSAPDLLKLLVPYFLLVVVPVGALIDSLIGALLRKQVFAPEAGSGISLLGWVKRFYCRMLLLNAIHAVTYIVLSPLDSVLYVPLRYVAAYVVWQDCSIGKAFSGTLGFISTYGAKFLPVWLLGTAILIGVYLTHLSSARDNPMFVGLVHLVVAYFDFAMLAIAVVFFLALQPKRHEALA